jgi:hypothetical protein
VQSCSAYWQRKFIRAGITLSYDVLSLLVIVYAAVLALASKDASAERLVEAHYEAPVERYRHFALGRPYEYSQLTATSDQGRVVSLVLDEAEVFEDFKPRIVKLATGVPDEILAIVSRSDAGSRLVLFRLNDDHLDISAQSPSIGTPMRWLNLVGVADLDGDGHAEIVAVTTPHIGGKLRVYRRQNRDLVEFASLPGFSNHVFGSPEQGLSAPISIEGQMRLLVTDASRFRLRIIELKGARLVEIGQCLLSEPINGKLKIISSSEISVGLPSGRQLIALKSCLK